MPLEIRELIIKASVGEAEETGAAETPASGSEQDRESLVNLCVEKVLEILKEKAER